jgi:hypothetical protein
MHIYCRYPTRRCVIELVLAALLLIIIIAIILLVLLLKLNTTKMTKSKFVNLINYNTVSCPSANHDFPAALEHIRYYSGR